MIIGLYTYSHIIYDICHHDYPLNNCCCNAQMFMMNSEQRLARRCSWGASRASSSTASRCFLSCSTYLKNLSMLSIFVVSVNIQNVSRTTVVQKTHLSLTYILKWLKMNISNRLRTSYQALKRFKWPIVFVSGLFWLNLARCVSLSRKGETHLWMRSLIAWTVPGRIL